MKQSWFGLQRAVVTAAVGVTGLMGSMSPRSAAAQHSVSLDEPTTAHDEPFSLIGGIRELADGRLIVSDALEEKLYVLDPGLEAAEAISRNGQGPDEYRQPDGLFPWPGDSTLMVDLGNGRLTTIGPDYSFGRTIPVVQQGEAGLQIILPEGADAGGLTSPGEMG
jgi:hypothetical protein